MRHDAATDLLPIGQVVAMLQSTYPDVTHSSLRFLEREGLLHPVRTPGQHRLYRPEDIARIRQIKAWQAQRLSLEEIRHRLLTQEALGPAPEIARRFVDQLVQGDLAAATQTVRRADELGMPLVQLFQDVLTPALREVGARWARGELPVGQEKAISELARDLIAELSLRHADPDPQGPTVVAACVAGEHHDLGLRMLCGLLQARGWRVAFLGADVAPPFLLEAIRLHQPTVVLLSATLEPRLPAITAAIAVVAASELATGPPTVVIGGPVAKRHAAAFATWPNVVATVDGLEAAVAAIQTNQATADPMP
jgi:MerR family transcriptional regulator, light-induced transcriptional regulator